MDLEKNKHFGSKPKSFDLFVEEAKEIHGDKYSYDKFVYKNNKTSGLIHCNKCGCDFKMIPTNHICKKQGCPQCNGTRKYKTDEWIGKCKEKYNYDYSESEYLDALTPIKIICHEKDEKGNEHGAFWKIPRKHLNGNQGCPKCSKEKRRKPRKIKIRNGKNNKLSYDEFVERAKNVHGDKYEYFEDSYVNYTTKTEILCKKHGIFKQSPQKHVNRHQGCPKCKIDKFIERQKLSTEEFIKRSKEIHGDKYDYSLVKYSGNDNKVEIICPVHGKFYQKPVKHWIGQGCPKCNQSHLEREVELTLNENNIDFTYQATKRQLPFIGMKSVDFYIPKLNVGIECQGIQHFEDNGFLKSEKVIERDKEKFLLCEQNNVKIIYYSNLIDKLKCNDFYKDKKFFNDVNNLIKFLKDYETTN